MKDIKDFLKQIMELEKLALKRAEEFLIASGCSYEIYDSEFQFSNDKISICFVNSGGHGADWVFLTIEDVEMNDLDWSKLIDRIKKETNDRKIEEQSDVEKEKLESDRKEYLRLKTIFESK